MIIFHFSKCANPTSHLRTSSIFHIYVPYPRSISTFHIHIPYPHSWIGEAKLPWIGEAKLPWIGEAKLPWIGEVETNGSNQRAKLPWIGMSMRFLNPSPNTKNRSFGFPVLVLGLSLQYTEWALEPQSQEC